MGLEQKQSSWEFFNNKLAVLKFISDDMNT